MAAETTRYRAVTASLLVESVAMTRKLERWLDGNGGQQEVMEIDLSADPTATFRIMCALLLRKARLHTMAVLRANETDNIHSLAVQMRPVLECAGQVVLIFDHLIIAPDLKMEPARAASVIGDYVGGDYYDTIIRVTKGKVGHKELLEDISEVSAMAAALWETPERATRKGKSLKQADKVGRLLEGKQWYDYLSEYFCHGRGDWRGPSWRGGVVSKNTVRDEFTFAGLMDYLVEQVGVMNAYAALCPIDGDDGRAWVDATLAQLNEAREKTRVVRDSVVALLGTGTARQRPEAG